MVETPRGASDPAKTTLSQSTPRKRNGHQKYMQNNELGTQCQLTWMWFAERNRNKIIIELRSSVMLPFYHCVICSFEHPQKFKTQCSIWPTPFHEKKWIPEKSHWIILNYQWFIGEITRQCIDLKATTSTAWFRNDIYLCTVIIKWWNGWVGCLISAATDSQVCRWAGGTWHLIQDFHSLLAGLFCSGSISSPINKLLILICEQNIV